MVVEQERARESCPTFAERKNKYWMEQSWWRESKRTRQKYDVVKIEDSEAWNIVVSSAHRSVERIIDELNNVNTRTT